MAVDAAVGRGFGCHRCGVDNRPEDRFCQACGCTLAAAPDAPPWLEDAAVDSTTRYLCAAAHLDPEFARAAVAEYLVEPLRAVPPSPGVDAAAVLRDAVAARRRGKIRDGLLLALLAVALFTFTGLTIAWTVVSVLIVIALPGDRSQHRTRAILGAALALVVLVFLMSLLSNSAYLYLLSYELRTTSDATLLGLLLLGLLVYGVLAVDELTVEHLVRDRFRRNTFRADAGTTSGWERIVRTLGLVPFRRELNRVAAAHRESDGRAQVVVHRGWVPFVGSGALATDHTISLPLESADDARTPQPFTAAELNTAVRAAMGELRSSASLSPGRRLARLEIHEQVFLPADQLTHLARTPLAGVFTDRHRPPADSIPIEVARELANSPVEAGRYYVCARVEAWDRNLVSSCFLTSATDRRTLYLEWSNSVLFPLKARYRAIDRPAEVAPGVRALLAALALPATAPSRIASLLHYFRRIPERHDEVVADRHGAGPSIRELAAAGASNNFFQDADAIRYLKLVEQAMFRAVSEFLADRGYAIDDVMAQARARIAGSITINGGNFNNSAIGIGRTEQTTAAGNPSTQPPAPRRTQ